MLQPLIGLEQHEAPHRLVDLVVLRVVLLHDEASEFGRDSREVAHGKPQTIAWGYSVWVRTLGTGTEGMLKAWPKDRKNAPGNV